MSDLISRQAAIDAVNTALFPKINTAKDAEKALRNLPSAQPGQRNARVFQGIIVEYPSYCVYPEYKGKPYFSIKYTENGQEFIGYGTYKPEVLSEYLKEYFMSPTQPGWIPCSERPPEKSEWYLLTAEWDDGLTTVTKDRYVVGEGWTCAVFGAKCLAWMPLPEPWKGEQNG